MQELALTLTKAIRAGEEQHDLREILLLLERCSSKIHEMRVLVAIPLQYHRQALTG